MSTRGFVSPIPDDYVARNLRRLLPGPDVIARLCPRELREVDRARKEWAELIEHDPIRFFLPHEHGDQRKFLTDDDPNVIVQIFVAGNKGGKTTAGAIRHLEEAAGKPLWGTETRKFHRPTPNKGAVFAEDFESHNEITVPALRAWAPPGFIRAINRNPAGHVTSIEYANDSISFFGTYEQGAAKREGKDWRHAWFDEPPSRDHYIAVRRGLVTTKGRCFITATLVKESWIYDEQEFDFVRLYEGDIDDNEWLTAFHRDAFLSTLTDDERAVRKSGRPASLSGVIYKTFRDPEPFLIPVPDKQPTNCPIIMAVDPHERRPCHVLWGWVDSADRIVWFDWLLTSPAAGLDTIFAEIDDTCASHPSRPALTIMDPNRGPTPQMGGSSWEQEFEAHGYSVQLGIDNRDMGHTKVRSLLDPTAPGMYFTERCRGKGGPVWQMQRYMWDDSPKARRGDSKQQPKDSSKDFPDCIRYAAMAELKQADLVIGPPVLSRLPRNWRKESAVHAY